MVWGLALACFVALLFADTMANGGTVLRTGVTCLTVALAVGPLWPRPASRRRRGQAARPSG